MNKQNFTKVFKNMQYSFKKHSPEILTGLGIAGMVTTTILAVKATPKALDLIAKAEAEDECDGSLTKLDVVKVAWKPYIPAIVTGAASATCLIGAQSVNLRRNAALYSAYKISETALSEYKEKVVETIGEKKEQTIRDKVAKEKVEKKPASKSEIIVTQKGNTRCLDAAFGRRFTSDIDTIKKIVNELNARMVNGEMYISLNEFYNELGLSNTELGDSLGWNVNDGLIDVEFSSQLDDDGVPCIVISYLVAPKYDFSSFS